MSKFENDVNSIMNLFHDVSKNRWSGKTVDGIVWVAGYMPSKKELVVILADREDSHKNTRIVIKDGERDKLFKTFKNLYGDERISNEEEMTAELKEEASVGATSAACVAAIPHVIGKTVKRKNRKKRKVSKEVDSVLFKESILNDMPCETKIGEYSFKYFLNEGKWYMSVNNSLVKTFDKDVMMETFDQIVDDEEVTTDLLEDFSCYEMNILMEDGDVTSNPTNTTNTNSVNPTTTSNTTDDTTDDPNHEEYYKTLKTELDKKQFDYVTKALNDKTPVTILDDDNQYQSNKKIQYVQNGMVKLEDSDELIPINKIIKDNN